MLKKAPEIFGTISNEKGFTFIELMVTSVVAFVVILGFVGAATAIQNASTAAFERTKALQDAHQVIETMRNTASSGTFPANVTTAYPANGTVSGYSSVTNEVITVTYVNVLANPLDTTVTVTYKQNGTLDTSVALRTLMTQRSS